MYFTELKVYLNEKKSIEILSNLFRISFVVYRDANIPTFYL